MRQTAAIHDAALRDQYEDLYWTILILTVPGVDAAPLAHCGPSLRARLLRYGPESALEGWPGRTRGR